MPRHKSGKKLGRPFTYTSDEQRPVTVSLRLPRTLFDRMEEYRTRHGLGVTEVLVDGLTRCLSDLAPAPDHESTGLPTRHGETPSGSLDARALEPEPAPPVKPVVSGPATPPPGYYFGSSCPHGHLSHGYSASGEPQNLRNWRGQCLQCLQCATESGESRPRRPAPRRRTAHDDMSVTPNLFTAYSK